jgi:ketosteroid isomerase-like protein
MDPEYSEPLLTTVREHDPQTVLHLAYDAIIRGDFDSFGQWVTDDVELHIAGFGPLDGTWRGRNDVVAATRKNFAQIESQQPVIEGLISQGDSVAVLVREKGVLKTTGQTYTLRALQWFTFADGKIKKIDEIAATELSTA